MYNDIAQFIKSTFKVGDNFLPMHEPRFIGNERKYVLDALDSTFVSSVGKFVDEAERSLEKITGCKRAVLCVNGTAALHVSLILSGVKPNTEVLTQALTFVATANAISYIGATPVFLDVNMETLGLDPQKLEKFLYGNCEKRLGKTYNKTTGREITACLPMHTFGHPCKIVRIAEICTAWNIALVEDAAEAIGSMYEGKHLGNWGKTSALSFNGNKIITSGGGGAILTNDEEVGNFAKHITTTAKKPHPWEFEHDFLAYNYRMPNLNAALLLAQLEQLEIFVDKKRMLAESYKDFFKKYSNIKFIQEPSNSRSNYWLCTIKFSSHEEQQEFIQVTNRSGVMTRPVWKLMNHLDMYKNCPHDDLTNSIELESTVVNIPSSVIV
jgi:aminotransferase in exopolysaccharide biosynthesis